MGALDGLVCARAGAVRRRGGLRGRAASSASRRGRRERRLRARPRRLSPCSSRRRLRETAVHAACSARSSAGTIGLFIARAIGSGSSGPTRGDRRVEFLHSFILIVLPYLGLVLGARHGEWLEPARLVGLFRVGRPRAPLQDSRHERHHRRPDRRRLRDRLRRRHARHSAVRAEGAAAGRRFRAIRSSATAAAAASTSFRGFRRCRASR